MIAMLRRRLMMGGGAFEFTYTGHFTDKIEGSKRVIKFTSSGTLNVSGSVVADVYLLVVAVVHNIPTRNPAAVAAAAIKRLLNLELQKGHTLLTLAREAMVGTLQMTTAMYIVRKLVVARLVSDIQ